MGSPPPSLSSVSGRKPFALLAVETPATSRYESSRMHHLVDMSIQNCH